MLEGGRLDFLSALRGLSPRSPRLRAFEQLAKGLRPPRAQSKQLLLVVQPMHQMKLPPLRAGQRP
jgi:hypothetical protein